MIYIGKIKDGAGGASRAFEKNNGRRIKEIEKGLEIIPFPGSLNVTLDKNFNWGKHKSVKFPVLDVNRKNKKLPWQPHMCNFYHVIISAKKNPDYKYNAWIIRWDRDIKTKRYKDNYVGIVAEVNLRNALSIINGDEIILEII